VEILGEKFSGVNAFGPQQMVEFYNSANVEEREMQAGEHMSWCGSFIPERDGKKSGRRTAAVQNLRKWEWLSNRAKRLGLRLSFCRFCLAALMAQAATPAKQRRNESERFMDCLF